MTDVITISAPAWLMFSFLGLVLVERVLALYIIYLKQKLKEELEATND